MFCVFLHFFRSVLEIQLFRFRIAVNAIFLFFLFFWFTIAQPRLQSNVTSTSILLASSKYGNRQLVMKNII